MATYDHDFPSYGLGKVIPYGVYDVGNNEALMYLATGSDTGELACDAIRHWWIEMGRARYGRCKQILILADSGGSNGCGNRLFKEQLWKVSNWLGVKIRVAHLPSYCSKYNPIDHRLFCHVTRSLQGMVLKSIDQVAEAISRTSTTTGLRVITKIASKIYRSGVEASRELITYPCIQHDADRPKTNYFTARFGCI